MYATLARGEKDTKESEYMSRIKLQQIADDTFHITEYIVIRPGLKKFLEDIENIEIPTFILICSRNDDARTQNLVDKLDLSIDGEKFLDVVDFVPRSYFRVKITLPDYPEPVTAKALLS